MNSCRIDACRDKIESGKPILALTLEPLLARVAIPALLGVYYFELKANIGHCHLVLGDEARAASWLSEAYHHAPTEPKAKANFALSYLLQGQAKPRRPVIWCARTRRSAFERLAGRLRPYELTHAAVLKTR